MDLALDEVTGDLIVEGGLQFVEGVDELRQRLTVGLTINLQEFFTHQNYGLPWLRNENNTDSDYDDIQYFLGDADTTVSYIVSSIEEYILSIDTVDDVTSSYTYSSSTRKLTYTPQITATNGDLIDFPAYVLDV